jgi:hypothetical protein
MPNLMFAGMSCDWISHVGTRLQRIVCAFGPFVIK